MFRQQALRQMKFLVLILALCCCLSGCSSQGSPVSAVHLDGPTITASAASTATPVGPANPQRLLIPAISVNAPVEQVNILSTGDLGTPTGSPWTDTGWYANGPRPGEQGSAVIDGHLDRPGGSPAVFWYLRNVRVGNEVDVFDSDGTTLRFRVTDVESYPPQDAPIQQIFGNNGGKYLNLITCAGDWIPSQHQTALRLVVYTTLI
jgi:LPXTG-site transpeptidase (sortase) family protein